ncbi:glycosyltransferase family 9 protein [Zymobacter sp. IVIA_12111.31 C1]|uniref:glycosyltransferase family 9 protein n=1 Tax=Zymobacter sp. IVIA_12111.31 C1 TaxID=3394854 RepID=UPI0039C00FFC
MKVIKKLKEKLEIKRYDFKPEIADGPIEDIENAVFYCVDGIGDIMVASPIIRAILEKCTGRAYFICSPTSQLYIDLLDKQYSNVVIVPVGKKKALTESSIAHTAANIRKQGKIDVVVNGLGRVSPRFAQLACLLKPRAVLSAMESAKRTSRPKMVHKSVHYANLLYRRGVSIVDCWGIIAQMVGCDYNRTLLFPVADITPERTPYIAVSLLGASWGPISEENAIHICQAISRHYKNDICLIVSPGIEAMCLSIASTLENVFVSPLPPSLESSGAYIKHAQALVAVCSAPVHIAGAFDTPVLVIRGVERSAWRPVVSHAMEYITNNRDINEIDNQAFEACFAAFINKIG